LRDEQAFSFPEEHGGASRMRSFRISLKKVQPDQKYRELMKAAGLKVSSFTPITEAEQSGVTVFVIARTEQIVGLL